MKYPGGKWSLANWIINMFPEHRSYLEPFFGSGAILFNKQRSGIETVNDLDGNVVNLFYWIRHDPERLAQEIYFTPYAREIYDDSYKGKPSSDFDRAVQFYIRLNMGYGFRTNGEKVGWKNDIQGREKAYAAQDWCKLPEKIIAAAERLRGVQFENRPAVELIQRFNYDNVFIYCDPPYVLSTRHGKQYKCEMNDDDQEELLDQLLKHKGKVMISGYDSELYRRKLNDWHREEIETYTLSKSLKREIVWMNYEKPLQQMTLSDTFFKYS